jgi:YaiO family outer membrane protein
MILTLYLPAFASTNPDDLLREGMKQAKAGSYSNAKVLIRAAIALDSSRSDLWVSLANVYGWEHQMDSARVLIQHAYAKDPSNREVYDTWLNLATWDKQYTEVLRVADLAVTHHYPDAYNLMLKRMDALRGLEKYEEALVLTRLMENRPYLDSSQINLRRRELAVLNQRSSIAASYAIDLTDGDNAESQHLAFLEYSRRLGRTVAAVRLNGAIRFGETGLQAESDVYQIFDNKSYLYLNAGYGFGSLVFPHYRAGVEYTLPFAQTYEATAGARYLGFSGKDVYLLTGQIARYQGIWWYGLRPFYTLKNDGNALSVLLQARRYDANPLSFNEFEIGYGYSPDERLLLEGSRNYGLNAFQLRLCTNRLLFDSNQARLSLGYHLEEQADGSYRNRFILDLTYRFRLP